MTQAISDATLTAYLDGALDPETADEVEAALASDPSLVERLAALEVPMAALRQGFDELLAAASEMPALPARSTRSQRRWPEMAAALVIGVAFGAGALLLMDTAPAKDWKVAVADYQVLYVPETLAMPAPSADTAQAQLARASAAVGVDLSDAVTPGDLSFRRAQLLGFEGQPLVQVAYLSAENQPIALCVTAVDAPDSPPTALTISGLASAHWVADGMGFLMIGGDDLERVEDWARELQRKL